MQDTRTYIAIDLKSFYASQECIDRNLDPLTANLVVADASRTEKTICLAVTPSLKALGVPARPRLFEVLQKIQELNALRRCKAPGRTFTGKSCDARELAKNPALEIDFITAPPRMASYIEASNRIYGVYLRHVAPEDIHVYSIDEVFIDATPYLGPAKVTAKEFTRRLLRDVLAESGITATAGIGTNLFLCKVAMDIVAKHAEPDEYGARIAELDEMRFRETLWSHRPLTDFWRIGPGYARKLEARGLYTMGDIARCSVGRPCDFYNESLLYNMFGVNAQLLIDHAWGWEPCTIADIKSYRPSANSLGSGQVLHEPYPSQKARLIVREMTDLLTLDLVEKGFVTDQIVLTIGYDRENLADPQVLAKYRGPVTHDHYGRPIPKHAHGTARLSRRTSSTSMITASMMELFDRIADPALLVRRVNIAALHVLPEHLARREDIPLQLDLFADPEEERQRRIEDDRLSREKRRQLAILAIRKKYGKNAILKGMNFEEGATTIDRNRQIGGHRA